jgi:putative addiction module component (TIGR02574 family)
MNRYDGICYFLSGYVIEFLEFNICEVFMTLKKVIESAKGLTVSEKAFVAHCLISSLEAKQDDDVDNAWKELAEKRCDELLSGKVSGISWEEVKKQIRP